MIRGKRYDNIVFIASYVELAKKAQKVIEDLKIDMELVYSKNIQHSVQFVNESLKAKNIDAIITRGGTALKLRDEFDIPVIEIEVTILDIIRAIEKAKAFGRRIGVIGYPNIISNISTMSSFMDVEIHEIRINSYHECTNAVKKASELDVDVIVGDRIAVETANRFGFRGELIESDSYECITKALYRAIEMADLRKSLLAHGEELKIITELTHSGIIAVDKYGKITLCNAEACSILNISSENAIGKLIDDIVPDFNINEILENGQKKFDELVSVDEKYLMLHKIPIIIGGSIHGAVITFQKLDQIQNMEIKARKKLAEKGHIARHTFDSIIGCSESIKRVIEKAKNYSLVDSVVLINGETGTGKEVFAQSIHNYSRRKNGPFVGVNCAALPYTLLESELFGYVKGAFTGARAEGKIGLFEQAHGGTIFLDEIAEIPMEVQARLLRVLQEGQIQKIGDDRIITVDVRIISATNKNLKELIKENKFREDLYYRLNVLNIKLPSLNDRIEDIPLFIEHFFKLKSKEYNITIHKIEPDVVARLCSISYPGNIRQLENIVERLVVESKDGNIKLENLSSVLDDDIKYEQFLNIDTITKKTIENALKITNNKKSAAAKMLGIDRSTLWRKMKDLEIE